MDFITTQISQPSEMLASHIAVIQELSVHFPDSLLSKVVTEKIDDLDKQQFLEAHILRENQLGELSLDKKEHTLV